MQISASDFPQNDLKYGDFNGDNRQDIVYYPKTFAGPIRIINGTSGTLILSDSIMLSSYYHVSSPGDINGDDFDDLLVSSSNRILIYYGAPDGLGATAGGSILLSDLLPSFIPNIVGFAEKYRDINSDGIMDILVTVGNSGTSENHGRLYVLRGGTSGFTTVTSFTGVDFEVPFNLPVKNLGDLNGDGFIDVGFQEYDYSSPGILYGTPGYFNADRKNYLNLDFDYLITPSAINNVGDVNNDGYNDLLISIPEQDDYDGGGFLFLGTSTTVNPTPVKSFSGIPYYYDLYYNLGLTSGPAGDVNGDGNDDFFIGGSAASYTHIYYGNPDVNLIEKQVNIGIPLYSMIRAGDVNGDGNDDWIAAQTGYPNNGSYLSLLTGNSSGIANVQSCPMTGLPLALEFVAKSGQTAGDVNNDGFDDLLIAHDNLDPSGEDEFGKVQVVTGAPVGVGEGGMTFGVFQDYFGDQYASGDFNGDGFSDVVAGRYGQITIYVFYGSASGIDQIPDLYLTEPMMAGWGESIEGIGDLNNDGFDDFLSYGMNGMTLMTGSPSGPVVFPGWNYGSFSAYKAGDANNDGFDDFFLRDGIGYRLFYGSASGPVMTSYLSALLVQYAGDVNADGYDDMLTYNPVGNSVGLLLGNATGYSNPGITIPNAFSPNGIGDFNNDGFDDIGVSSKLDTIDFNGAPSRVDIYLGSASGIQTTIFTTIRSTEKYHRLTPQPRIGDFNKDGKEDLLVSSPYKSWLVYGIGGVSNITCPTETSIYADSSCMAEVTGVDPPGNPSLYRYSVTGYSIFEGMGSLNGKNLKAGTYFVTYSLLSDPQQQCTFTLRIRDTIAPKLVVPNPVVLCNNTTMEANVPLLKIENNCQIATINYQLTGATSRTGTGLNANGSFNKGTTTVTWTVTDSSGNISTGKMNVTILDIFNVKIPKAYQINSQQSQENMIYLGYANNTLRLTAYEANSANHNYRWTTGDTTRFTRVRHDVPGRYKYSVFVTNEYGCRARADVFVKVVNIYCTNTGNISMCYNGSTVCVSPSDVPAMVANGARLGKCGVSYQSNDMITVKEEENFVGELTLTASPNPTNQEFTIRIDGTKGKPYALRIVNSVGNPVFMKQGITENIVRAGGSFQKGVYFAEVICGNERKVIKLLKVR